ncbi:hypothetical protein PPK13_gp72 [Bacillus phage Ray17]|uniref:Uncharacterized protein n=1 Tax=Bacillus phage Ray17 TaxID=2315627 RepID=A0A386K9G3_9CAUD|nr:hypothetical protein PPK13_gp72 [Bacillus phage Ray17]AYD80974.1 hypothetical protein Ray17_73 [Bacillus phage Ray17]
MTKVITVINFCDSRYVQKKRQKKRQRKRQIKDAANPLLPRDSGFWEDTKTTDKNTQKETQKRQRNDTKQTMRTMINK